MKKVFVILGVCVALIALVFLLWSNPDLGENIGNSMSTIFDNLIEGKYEEYNSNFVINELGVKNNDYYFKTLNENQKKMYTAVAIAVKNMDQIAKVKRYDNNVNDDTVRDASVAMKAFLADHPEAFYVDVEYEVLAVKSVFGKEIQIKLKYTSYEKDVLKEQIKTLKEKINSIVSGLTSTSDIDKEIELHNIICDKVEYYKYSDINLIPIDKHSIYGALVKNSAVCDGIAKTMQILLDRCNIDNILVVGKIDELHAWNLVKLEDEWYNLDVTFDKAIKDNQNYIIHSYFNVTTENIAKTHTFEQQDLLPSANATKYNYYIYKDLYISNTDDFDVKLQSIILKNTDSKILEFATDSSMSNVPDRMITTLQKNKNSQYLTENLTKVSYYNILNSYIVRKVL